LKPLLDYYRDRQIWVVDADAAHPRIEPYHSDATAQSSRWCSCLTTRNGPRPRG